ncbi:helix-turn-helix domain-containing protein [Thermobifida halotolerans]|uniref:Helix-turn-helix domain-containing protein n=1 Tax=Thermobifida halotolerans TaxID=483545 RepID=A0AA97LXB3_9ACTN|nr:helix-turn-helix domain-containing protein [Thermobifida halotolerans]UOE19887.1 helix-turn-helix domain-containing protein [Thermobifida halotolerans]
MATIGQGLVDARRRRGRSVHQLSEATRIPPTVIHAMERDDFTACGGDFYARGHLRTLCAVLDIDPDPLLRRFDAEHAEAPPQPRDVTEILAPPHDRTEGRQWGWTAVVASAVVALAVSAWPGPDRPADRDTAPAAHHADTATDRTRPAEHDQPPTHDTDRATAAPHGTPVTLRVTAHRRTWISVTDASGTNLFTGVLTRGQTRDWTAPRQLRLHLSDAGGVRLWANGEALGTPGTSGEVTRLTFTADNRRRD